VIFMPRELMVDLPLDLTRDYAWSIGRGSTGKLVLTRMRPVSQPDGDDVVAAVRLPIEDGAEVLFPEPVAFYAERIVGFWGDPLLPTHWRDGRYVRLVRRGRRLVEATDADA
jgi:hypothetical protein